MTPTETTSTSDLSRPFVERGFQLIPFADPTAVLGGLSAAEFRDPGAADEPPVAAIAIAAAQPLEVFDEAVQATQAAFPDSEAGTALAVESMEQFLGATAAPVENLSICKDDVVIGVLSVRIERRGEAATADSAETSAIPTNQFGDGKDVGSTPQPTSDLTKLRDVVLEVSVELGRHSLTLAQMLNLTVGSIVELDRPAGAPVDIRVNGVLFGRGEVVVIDDEYAVRIIEIIESLGS